VSAVVLSSLKSDAERVVQSDVTAIVPRQDDPRVLYLTDLAPSGKFGSMEEQIFTITRAFCERGGLFLPVFGGDLSSAVRERYGQAGLPVEGLNLHHLSLPGLRRLLRIIRSNKITTIHWNFYSPINTYVWLLSVLCPALRHCLTDHTSRRLPLDDPPRGIKKLIKKILFRRYEKVWCISNFVVACLEHTGTWANLTRCTYFINTERFKPNVETRAEMRKRLGADNKFVVLFVAHIIQVKGGDIALKAVAELPEFVHLWVVGDGADLSRLRSLSEELSITGRVQFMGNQSHVQPYMQAADCFICPSLWGEATGLVNLEAQASGLPLVASAIGGIPEFVDHGSTGFLFPPGDHRQLAEYLCCLAESPELHRRFSEAARKLAVDRFSIERRLDEYVRAYE
jgi:glycosyltransferase involved in cell wall biosynthesis